jgi:hypothetical protein
MESELIRKIYTEYLDNLNFKIRHISILNSTEKQILQELIFNESIRINSFYIKVKKLEKKAKRISRKLKKYEGQKCQE